MKKLALFILTCLLHSSLLISQVAVNTNGNPPDPSAGLDVSYSDKGFLMPRLTQDQIRTISNPANGLIVFCSTDNKFYTYIESENIWKLILFGSEAISQGCDSMTINHVEGAVAPVTKTVNYGTVYTNLTGSYKCWITSNLGADRQATSVDDATELSAGWYWQFNRQQGYKHDGIARTPDYTWINSINENSNWLIENDPCSILLGTGWRLPTFYEWENITITWGWTNWNGPWNSALKMHTAGYLYYSSGSLSSRGTGGSYYCINQYTNSTSWGLIFGSTSCSMSSNYKSNAYTVRCLKDL